MKTNRKLLLRIGQLLLLLLAAVVVWQKANGKALISPVQHGWKGEYFSNTELKGEPEFIEIDPAPGMTTAERSRLKYKTYDHSIRWRGWLRSNRSQEYTFELIADDFCKMELAGHTLVASAGTNTLKVRIEESIQPVTLTFVQRGGHRYLNLKITPAASTGVVFPEKPTFISSTQDRLAKFSTAIERFIIVLAIVIAAAFIIKKIRSVPKNHLKKKQLIIPAIVLLAVSGAWVFKGSKSYAGVSKGKSVILISIDTLRPDRLGSYGYELNTSPNLDRFASEGILFENVYSQATSTLPSHGSIFTSLYPTQHRGSVNLPPLHRNVQTITEIFKDAGYKTAAFVGGSQIKEYFGLDQGFDVYKDDEVATGKGIVHTLQQSLSWLKANSESPYFLFVHTYEVHDPYTFHSEFNPRNDDFSDVKLPREITKKYLNAVNNLERKITGRELEYVSAAYDSEIRFMDHHLKKFLDEIDPETLVVITSDHGEEFGEHGRVGKHGHTLYEELLRVPLIVIGPGLPSNLRIRERVRSIDIAPSILKLAGLKPLPGAQGTGWLDLLQNNRWNLGRAAEDRPVLSEVSGCGKPPCDYSREPYWAYFSAPCRAYRCKNVLENTMYSWIDGDSKFIQLPDFGFKDLQNAGEFYDLAEDRDERKNLMDASPELFARTKADARAMIRKTQASVVAGPQEPEKGMTPELIEELKTLGYID